MSGEEVAVDAKPFAPDVPTFRYVLRNFAHAMTDQPDVMLAEFDRMIERVRAEAWGEGHTAGWTDGKFDHPSAPLTTTRNPYREQST